MLQNGLYFFENRYYNVNNILFRRSRKVAVMINYQLSIFGTYNIVPTPENVTLLMNAVNQATGEMFLPNLISGQQVEIPTNRITTISNLGYVTQNQKYNIAILNDRIDISFNRIDDTELTIVDFYNLAVKALSAIMENSHLQARRLAANIQAVGNTLSEEQIANMGKRVITSAAYYSEKPLVEWSTRINSESSIQISGTDEKLNTILSISTAKSAPTQSTALIYHLDINTLPLLTELRFDAASLNDFVTGVTPIVDVILDDVERLTTIE